MNNQDSKFQAWRPEFYILDNNSTIHKKAIASCALKCEDDIELSCCMKQLTAISVVDMALYKLVLSEGNL